MGLFKKKKKTKDSKFIINKSAAKNSVLFAVGCLISALSFNLFFVPNNFVGGGLSGLAIVINNIFASVGINTIILVGNIILVVLSIITLGFKESLMSVIGALFYTVFVYLTEFFPEMINFSFDNVLLYVLAAGVVSGFGEALVFKSGFNTGGTSILAKIIQHYTKLPLGVILRYISIVIIAFGGFRFGYTAIMYSLIITVISTYMVDKFMIGISEYKTFFIHTDMQEEVVEFITKVIESGVTVLDTKGAHSQKRKKMLMCVVPTEKYGVLKSAIKEVDPDAFIVVSDCYEVLGGTKRKKLLFDNE